MGVDDDGRLLQQLRAEPTTIYQQHRLLLGKQSLNRSRREAWKLWPPATCIESVICARSLQTLNNAHRYTRRKSIPPSTNQPLTLPFKHFWPSKWQGGSTVERAKRGSEQFVLTPQRVGSSFDGFPLIPQTGIQSGIWEKATYESPEPVHLLKSSSEGFHLLCAPNIKRAKGVCILIFGPDKHELLVSEKLNKI